LRARCHLLDRGHGSHFRPQPESQLSEIASQAGRDPEHLAKNAVLLLLQRDARYRAGVRKGLEQAERGDFVEERGMETRSDRMLQSGCASADCLRPPTFSTPSTTISANTNLMWREPQ
jgi:predicted transcriptional regulator